MNRKAPVSILMDQAAAMRVALAITMPNTRNQWCIWHITYTFGDKLRRYKEYKELKEELLVAIYDSFTIDDFESNWNELMEKYGLQENYWLKVLYKEREMWVPAFMKHIY
ncbi:Protein FAR1-RELATED SEQUENCE 7 [Bienertia sinuspersici]